MNPKRWICCFLLLWLAGTTGAQNLLSKNISLEVNRQKLGEVLEIISNKGNFYFSYHSDIVKKDSLVSFAVRNKTVKEVLDILFDATFEFRESGNYLIIRKTPLRVTLITRKEPGKDKIVLVSGYVFNEISGAAIHKASVYEKQMLVSALTNEKGYFRLRFKNKSAPAATLTVSKEAYADNTVSVQPLRNQELTIVLMPLETESKQVIVAPEDYTLPGHTPRRILPDSLPPAQPATSVVEEKGIGRFLLSARQRIQTLNLKNFFTTRPFQVSLVPGLGSHGQMSAQVVNKFSVNVLGGYTAGTSGFELGGLFNINKKNVQYFQAAGLFNAVGGTVRGFQLAGLNNLAFDSVRAFQAAGISNIVRGPFNGVQIGGLYNHAEGNVQGTQMAGIANLSTGKVNGVQIGGIMNFTNRDVKGVQIAGILNYTRHLRGLQIGLINIADSSSGFSLGLINLITKGYHKLSFYTTEQTHFNIAYKSGNTKCYSMLFAGMQGDSSSKLYTFGYGIGSERPLNRRKTITVNPELMAQQFYAGTWKPHNLNGRLSVLLNIKAGKRLSFFGGPAYNVLLSDQTAGVTGYRFPIQPAGYTVHQFSNRVSGWWGWSFGLHLF